MDRTRLFWILTVSIAFIMLLIYVQIIRSFSRSHKLKMGAGRRHSYLPIFLVNALFCPVEATRSTDEPVNVVMIFTNVRSNAGHLAAKFDAAVRSMIKYATVSIKLDIIVDGESRQVAEILLKKHEKNKLVTVQYHDMQALAKEVTSRLKHQMHYFRGHANAYYGDNLFFVSMILGHLKPFDSVSKIILLDVDIEFRADVSQLWRQFDLFEAETVIGIAREQQPVYRHVFAAYRSRHPQTRIGEPPPDGVTGFNSGVLLIDLAKMRTSQLYRNSLNLATIERLAKEYSFRGHLGDQDFYTLISTEYPQLFHVLSCGWNRQLCRYWQDKGYQKLFHFYHTCEEVVKIYHGNCDTEIPKEIKK